MDPQTECNLLRSRVAVLERELVNAAQQNSDMMRELRVLRANTRVVDEIVTENASLRAKIDALRREASKRELEALHRPSPQPATNSDALELRRLELELESHGPSFTEHHTGWQGKAGASNRPLSEADEVDRLIAMTIDGIAVDDKDDALLEARVAKLRGSK